ncbi:threonine aldolase [Colletotrichum sojae]|uniref:Threonine aldolase n=1 Tax=Colletotrichum sojae TaxID=2175907 RepID=A0A8H6JMC7_9PEZI|nr:threonine aldolase [Colletotrichum sojae]
MADCQATPEVEALHWVAPKGAGSAVQNEPVAAETLRRRRVQAAGHKLITIPNKDGKLTDIFWIGGTKVGALMGEAIVIGNPALASDFAFHVKQRGGLLVKGCVLGVQFLELYRSGLFLGLAALLSSGISQAGYELAAVTETNQVFPVLPDGLVAKLEES